MAARSAAPEDFAVPARIDLSRLRVAFTPDFGFAPTERLIAEAFAEKTGLFRHVFGHTADATPDCAGADEAFEVLRALGFLASHADKARTRPQDVGPNVRANVEEGLRYTAADVARAQTLQTTLYRRWQTFFQDWDVILTPSITISPRSWRELYPAEIDGKPTRTYFHWLALAYAVTLPGHPAVSLPLGARSARHAVRPADRRTARRRCIRVVGCRRTRGIAGRRRADRAPGSRSRGAEEGAADQRDGRASWGSTDKGPRSDHRAIAPITKRMNPSTDVGSIHRITATSSFSGSTQVMLPPAPEAKKLVSVAFA